VTLASIGDAVIATNNEGVITFLNSAAEQLTGWTQEDARHRPIHEVLHVIGEDTRKRVANAFEIARKAGDANRQGNRSILIAKDGREVHIEDSGALIKDLAGNVIGVIMVFHDIGEQRKAELERERLLASERAARTEAEASDRLKDEFLATVSHELRTPLNAILGWAATLNLMDQDEQTLRRGLTTIERNAKAQAQIIKDILDVSRIAAGKLKLELQPTDFAKILRSAVDSLSPSAAAKSLQIIVSIDSEPALVVGDPDRLQQIILNLVANAIKFTNNQGQIDIRLRRVDSNLELMVRDTGIGISREFLPHVFERFRQADASITRAHSGLGLGLAIVRHLVELHRGTVSAMSEGNGYGSTFAIRLPVASKMMGATSAEIEVKMSEAVQARAHALDDLNGLRVLVVDDEADTLEMLCVMLQESGAHVRSASSTMDALRIFGEWQPNVLLSDLGMPGEDGYTLIQQIRALPRELGGAIPAAALTAHTRAEDRERVLASGYQAHISKPVDLTTLLTSLSQLAGGKESTDYADYTDKTA